MADSIFESAIFVLYTVNYSPSLTVKVGDLEYPRYPFICNGLSWAPAPTDLRAANANLILRGSCHPRASRPEILRYAQE